MAISFKCQHCDKAYQLADELAGKNVRCLCGETLVVPARSQVANPAAARRPPDLFAGASSAAPGVSASSPQSSASHVDLFGSTESAVIPRPPSAAGALPPHRAKKKSAPAWWPKALLIGGLCIVGLAVTVGLGVLAMKMLPAEAPVELSDMKPNSDTEDAKPASVPGIPGFTPPSAPAPAPRSSGPGSMPDYAARPSKPLSEGQPVIVFEIKAYRGTGEPTRAAVQAVTNARQPWADTMTTHVDVEQKRIVIGIRILSVNSGPVKVALQRAGFTIGRTSVLSKGL